MIELNTLRRKLLVWLLVPLLMLFAIRVTHTYFRAIETSNRIYDRDLRSLAQSLTQQIAFEHGKPVVKRTLNANFVERVGVFDRGKPVISLPQAISQVVISDGTDRIYFTVRDYGGEVIAGNANIPPPTPGNTLDRIRSGISEAYDGNIENQDVRIVTRYFSEEQEEQEHFVLIEVAETRSKRETLKTEILGSALVSQALIIVLATAIVWFGVGKGLSSLKNLQRAVTIRSHLDLSPLDESEAPGEVQPLIRSINDLMSRIEKVMASQNQFIADAAHQLRTPLTGLKTQIAISLRQDTLGETRIHMQKLYTSVNRMTRLVNQLLALVRSDPDADKMVKKQEVSLNKLASAMTMEWVPEALKKQIDLGFEDDKTNAIILGDASRLKDMIDNLLDNAIRYTPPGGCVTVKVSGEGPPVLVVQDNGDGVLQAEQELVFERFYRVLGDRSDGSGLGLAIVKEIVRAHGGEVSLRSNPDGKGTVVSVKFPHPSPA